MVTRLRQSTVAVSWGERLVISRSWRHFKESRKTSKLTPTHQKLLYPMIYTHLQFEVMKRKQKEVTLSNDKWIFLLFSTAKKVKLKLVVFH